MHNDYQLAPEKLEISDNMLPKYCSNIADKYGIKVSAVKNLVPNLGNKSKYSLLQKSSVVFITWSELV